MPLVACPDCSRQVSDAAPACPNCGRPMVPAQIEQTDKWYKGGMVFSVLWGIVGFFIGGAIAPIAGAFFLISGLAFLLIFVVAAWWRHG